MLAVQVIDTGVGLTAEEIPELCNKFGKLFRTAEMNSEGIGLGLTISKALIEALSGTLEIISDGKDLGSVFSFTMKMKKHIYISGVAGSTEASTRLNT